MDFPLKYQAVFILPLVSPLYYPPWPPPVKFSLFFQFLFNEFVSYYLFSTGPLTGLPYFAGFCGYCRSYTHIKRFRCSQPLSVFLWVFHLFLLHRGSISQRPLTHCHFFFVEFFLCFIKYSFILLWYCTGQNISMRILWDYSKHNIVVQLSQDKKITGQTGHSLTCTNLLRRVLNL